MPIPPRPLPPRPADWGWEDPCSLSPSGTKATQEARCHRTPYGKAVKGRGRKGKIDPELTATEPGAQPQPPKHRPRALPPRLAPAGPVRLQPGGLGSPPQGDLPAGGPTSQRSASAFAGSGAGALPLPPRVCNPTPHLPAAAHPPPPLPLVRAWNRFAAQNPRAPRAELPRAGGCDGPGRLLTFLCCFSHAGSRSRSRSQSSSGCM